MQYLITFLEGIISFISPCMLPLLPVYISYFSADNKIENTKKHNVILRAIAFVLGFTIVFSLLGVFAGTIGALLKKYSLILNIVCGAIVIFFGLSYLEIIPLNFLKGVKKAHKATSVLSAFIFGVIYSISLTPCIGAFLGSALMLASTSGTAFKGLILLLCYSLGLGLPFVLSAIILDKLTSTIKFIKKHYKVINTCCGIFLIFIGILMASGLLNKFFSIFS